MKIITRLFLIAALASSNACVTRPYLSQRVVGWLCFGEVDQGDIDAVSVRKLTLDGREDDRWQFWQWEHAQNGMHLRLEGRVEGDGTTQEDMRLYVHLRRPSNQIIRRIELRVGDASKPSSTIELDSARQRFQEYFLANLRASQLRELLHSQAPAYVVAVSRNGSIMTWAKLDPTVVDRGQDAVRMALSRSLDLTKSYKGQCRQDHPMPDLILT